MLFSMVLVYRDWKLFLEKLVISKGCSFKNSLWPLEIGMGIVETASQEKGGFSWEKNEREKKMKIKIKNIKQNTKKLCFTPSQNEVLFHQF
jgi:hypothetical protein